MAVPKRGWRKITVRDSSFFWRAIGRDWGIEVIVVTDAAFIPGKTAQQLRFTLDYDHLYTDRGGGRTSFRQRAAVAPGAVQLAIERAVGLSPPFTGEHDQGDVSLPREALADVQARARVEVAR